MGEPPHRDVPRDPRTGRSAPAERIRQQETWVDLQLRQAMARGDFDDLPGFGKPLELKAEHDPEWWVKGLIEREQVKVVPPSLQLRQDDAELDARLDRLGVEEQVRREVADFNARVRWALYRPPEGPPVITRQRDVDAEVERWRARRQARIAAQRAQQTQVGAAPRRTRRRWWARLTGRP